MPARDGTGPWGEGPMTGRGMGFCVSGGVPRRPAFSGRGLGLGQGRGPGRGLGLGLGRRNRFGAKAVPVSY